ncbi:hypothetical protein [Phaeacidiphilus oryzae]|uniref:hypothetical protein n=1 Tax=Phaeacidiphilus oryzae TaxID=348818 RepID=UPI00055C3B27|nr:hypothetical protein [Phaeacidiphilus oryzae]
MITSSTRDARETEPAPAGGSGTAGPEGNERLTALTGAVLLVLFAAQGVTLLSISSLLTEHFFIGLLLVGPVCLKLGSTCYRAVRYYTGHAPYRRKGPPAPLLRLVGPLVALLSIAVLGSGLLLAFGWREIGPFPVLFLHKASFWAWAAVMAVHVLAYIWRLPRLIAADLGRRRGSRHGAPGPGRAGLRWSLVAASLAAGTLLAMAEVHLVTTWRQG